MNVFFTQPVGKRDQNFEQGIFANNTAVDKNNHELNVGASDSPDSPDSPNNDDNYKNNTETNNNSIGNMFLTLLVAEIKNQNPLNPTDSSQYINQLAQLTQVQTMQAMKSSLDGSATMVDNLQILSTGQLVGHKVMMKTNKVDLKDKVIDGRFSLGHNANLVKIILEDSAGVQHTINLGSQSKGMVNFTIDPTAQGLAPGKYKLKAEIDGKDKKGSIELGGIVNSVRIPSDGGAPLLNISGLGEVPFYKISQFGNNGQKLVRRTFF